MKPSQRAANLLIPGTAIPCYTSPVMESFRPTVLSTHRCSSAAARCGRVRSSPSNCQASCAWRILSRQAAQVDVIEGLGGDEWIGVYLPLLYAGAERNFLSLFWEAEADPARRFMAALHEGLAAGDTADQRDTVRVYSCFIRTPRILGQLVPRRQTGRWKSWSRDLRSSLLQRHLARPPNRLLLSLPVLADDVAKLPNPRNEGAGD